MRRSDAARARSTFAGDEQAFDALLARAACTTRAARTARAAAHQQTGRLPRPAVLRHLLLANSRSIRRLDQAMARTNKAQGLDQLRHDTAERRARTRLLIELGGLVVKAGLHERVNDDRATLLGGLLLLDDLLRGIDAEGPSPADLRTRWRRRGLRAFDASAADAAAVKGGKREKDVHPKG